MASVVLLCGANLGKRRFSPKAVEKALADLDATSLGAAGTFVVRKRVAASTLAKRVAAELPWDEPDMVIATEKDVLAAVAAGDDIKLPAGAIRRFATAMEKPTAKPKLPLEAPGIVVSLVVGPFALGTRGLVAETGVYPNEIVQKAFGAVATTRDWPTMEKIAALLRAPLTP